MSCYLASLTKETKAGLIVPGMYMVHIHRWNILRKPRPNNMEYVEGLVISVNNTNYSRLVGTLLHICILSRGRRFITLEYNDDDSMTIRK